MSNNFHKRRFSASIVRERLKQTIAANCRSKNSVRLMGMKTLATAVGVYTNPKTVEGDLWAYVEQVQTPTLIQDLYAWCRSVSKEEVIPSLPESLPQFQLELV